jgi:hypothetical protein
MSPHSEPTSKRAGKKILLVGGRENLSCAALERAVSNTGNTQRALFLFTGLRDIDPPYGWGLIPFAVHGLKHWLNPYIK